MTLSLAAVFIPVLFMGGVLGRLFREFSVTICVAILISGVVSVTLTPMLCSRFLKKPQHARRRQASGRRFEPTCTERAFDSAAARLRPHAAGRAAAPRRDDGGVRRRAGARPRVLFVIVPKGFIPDQDTDQIAVTTEAAQGTSYDKLVEYQGQVADIIRQRSERRRRSCRPIGGSAAQHARRPEPRPDRRPPEAAQRAEGAGQRHHREAAAAARARSPACEVYMQNPPTIRIGGQVSKSLYQYSMQSPDREALYAAARNAREGARASVAGPRGSDERPRGRPARR